MEIKCPTCGAVNSLDSLISDTEAAEVLKIILELGDVGRSAIRYVGLFRPEKSQLGWGRVAKLLKELMPQIQAGTVKRGGVEYQAPREAWEHGFNETLAARDTGRLKTPLKSHGYLYEIVAAWNGGTASAPPATARAAIPKTKPSQTLTAAAQLERLRR